MPARKLSPRKESKEESKEEHSQGYEGARKASKYGAMGFYYLLVLAALTSAVFFIVYATEAHGPIKDDQFIDDYEHDFGRMQIAAYGTMIALLFAILICVYYVAYLAHHHVHG